MGVLVSCGEDFWIQQYLHLFFLPWLGQLHRICLFFPSVPDSCLFLFVSGEVLMFKVRHVSESTCFVYMAGQSFTSWKPLESVGAARFMPTISIEAISDTNGKHIINNLILQGAFSLDSSVHDKLLLPKSHDVLSLLSARQPMSKHFIVAA
jgi:hypothetical protein